MGGEEVKFYQWDATAKCDHCGNEGPVTLGRRDYIVPQEGEASTCPHCYTLGASKIFDIREIEPYETAPH